MSTQKTTWRTVTDPKYLGSWSLEQGETLITKIVSAKFEPVTSPDGKVEELIVVHLADAPKNGLKLPIIVGNKANGSALEKITGSQYVEDWAGAQIEIYIDSNVKAFGQVVSALRIRKPKPVDKELESLRNECRRLLGDYKGEDREQLMAGLKASPNSKEVIRDAIAQMKAQ